MKTKSNVARFVAGRITETGKLQREIAEESGFDSLNVITMIRQGRTKVPLAKVGVFARALDTDPFKFLQMCMSEYQPDTWQAIEPYLSHAMTSDGLHLIRHLRKAAGGPYLSALDQQSRDLMNQLFGSLERQGSIIQ